MKTHGLPIAELRPARVTARQPTADVIAALEQASKGVQLGDLSIRALIDEGRA